MRTATGLRATDTMREGSLKAYTDRIAAGIRTDRSRKPLNRSVRLRGIDPIRLRTDLMRQNLPINPTLQIIKNLKSILMMVSEQVQIFPTVLLPKEWQLKTDLMTTKLEILITSRELKEKGQVILKVRHARE